MQTYRHTQVGYFMLSILLLLTILFAWIQITARTEPVSYDSGANLLVTGVMILILAIVASFCTLTVQVTAQQVNIAFGIGMFRKSFPTDEITAVKQVKNRWYYGWGIRIWFWPRMWIFNVSGFDAVEIHMQNGKIYRIGTDEPAALEAAIQQEVHQQKTS